jgi:hypothetical protein
MQPAQEAAAMAVRHLKREASGGKPLTVSENALAGCREYFGRFSRDSVGSGAPGSAVLYAIFAATLYLLPG